MSRKTAAAVAETIIRKGDNKKKGQGIRDLAWLLDAFNRQESGELIAGRFSVSRHQLAFLNRMPPEDSETAVGLIQRSFED